jgi:protein-S-isoprenylcysteine O-methyltransferase Ste14
MMHLQHAIGVATALACCAAVATSWLVGAIYNARRAPARTVRGSLRRLNIVAAICCAIVFSVLRTVPAHSWQALRIQSPWATAIATALILGSAALTLWARLDLGTMWSWDVELKQDHALRTGGPYGITRHPIYTGILGMVLGLAILGGGGRWLVLLPVGLVLLKVKLRIEESLLQDMFPEEYRRYRHRVPQLIPGRRIGRS